jgi:hypothetical protein
MRSDLLERGAVRPQVLQESGELQDGQGDRLRAHYTLFIHEHGGSFFRVCACLNGLGLGRGFLTREAASSSSCEVEESELAALERGAVLGLSARSGLA